MRSINSIPSARQRRRVSPLADELRSIFDIIDDEPLLASLAHHRWNGRPGWSLRALWRAYIAGYMLGLPTANALIRRLQDDAALRNVCDFEDDLPSRWTFNRFISRLSHHADAVEAVLAMLTDRLHDLLPNFGKGLAVDASTFRSWSNPNHDSDPEASFTAKTNAKGKKEWYWGFKLHLVTDTRYELPIAGDRHHSEPARLQAVRASAPKGDGASPVAAPVLRDGRPGLRREARLRVRRPGDAGGPDHQDSRHEAANVRRHRGQRRHATLPRWSGHDLHGPHGRRQAPLRLPD